MRKSSREAFATSELLSRSHHAWCEEFQTDELVLCFYVRKLWLTCSEISSFVKISTKTLPGSKAAMSFCQVDASGSNLKRKSVYDPKRTFVYITYCAFVIILRVEVTSSYLIATKAIPLFQKIDPMHAV